ncbi:M23 family metallopeptidase [Flavobacterium sp. MFBS3-15]|uniref:M23 family metallopeptidase n=1 Tax=Flavobacterium sp. MFBS3-15 TaxID=2989816 RepID=UPI002235526D|nr:M23 family metallopeptidase [Flavobacterium sp. MFBS3-15]MCW4469229.1 M23 family metallopeptidase [Flavobacterium sp. MFBS3-15]
MKSILFSVIFILSGIANAQDFKTYSESTENGFIVYADNAELCPVSVKFEWGLVNMKPATAQTVFVVPAKATKFKVTECTRTDPKKQSKGGYKTKYNFGDITIQKADDYIYDLPFAKGAEYQVWQGYNGTFSHQNENMLDFSMPEGTAVHAAREGIVVKVVESNSKNCPFKDCAQYNNYIVVLHADGSYAEYLHIKKDGAVAEPGDAIEKGQLIAYSGNVGWSDGPHLHLTVYLAGIDKKRSLKTKFRTGDGKTTEYLKEKSTYKKSY